MAKVFLDANYFIDVIHRKPEKQLLDYLIGHTVYISPLSFHIYCYIYKIKMPNKKVISQKEIFAIAEFSGEILTKALSGPTRDFEDNVQLHSAAQSECDIFLTGDKKLQKLGFFGKVEIRSAVL